MLRGYHYQAGRSFPGTTHQWLSLSEGSFLNLLALVPFTPTKFVDVGSGLGDKLWLASQVFTDIKLVGIENDLRSVNKSRKLLEKHGIPATILYQDILEHNYRGLHNIIYAYGPSVSLVVPITHKVLTELSVYSTFIQVCGTSVWKPIIFTRINTNTFVITLCGVRGKLTEVFSASRLYLLDYFSHLNIARSFSLNALIHLLRTQSRET